MKAQDVGQPEVVGVGECLIALRGLPAGPFHAAQVFTPHIVGAESNTAVGLARLGHRAAFVGRVGDDGLGDSIHRALRSENVDVTRLGTDPNARTGLLVRENRGFGPSRVWYYRTDSAGSRLSVNDIAESAVLIIDAQWLHVSGVTLALSAAAQESAFAAIDVARGGKTRVAFDVNLRAKLWSLDDARPVLLRAAGLADVVFASAEEATAITGEQDPWAAAHELLSLGPQTVVVRLGDQGAISLGRDGARNSCDAPAVASVVDTVGAGDAFTAGYLAGLLEDLSEKQALELGAVCGSYAVAAGGDITGLPSREEARVFMEGGDDVLR